MGKGKLSKFGIKRVVFYRQYDAKGNYNHPRIAIEFNEYGRFGSALWLHAQAHRLDLDPVWGVGPKPYDVVNNRRWIEQPGSALWDVGMVAYGPAYALHLDRVDFDTRHLSYLNDLTKALDSIEVRVPSEDILCAYQQKFLTAKIDVETIYQGRDGDFKSPYDLADEYRGKTRAFLYSPESYRMVAQYETEQAERLEQRRQFDANQEVA